MHLLADAAAAPTALTWFFLVAAVGLALGFEFVNGFHDTANAVATVIYTHTLRPMVAVVWSGLWNLIGVLTSTGAVAFGIVALLPVDLVINVGSAGGFAMVFALLLSAIIWNLGTWYLGLPASSSHTLIGSIMGVGLANSVITGHALGEGVNWGKAGEVGLSLLISPIFGFVWSAVMLLLLKGLIRNPQLFAEPEKGKAPPPVIRGILVLTCTGVSFAHGSNDGQKGMGLMMLILVGILPGTYALQLSQPPEKVHALAVQAQAAAGIFQKQAAAVALDEKGAIKELGGFIKPDGHSSPAVYAGLSALSQSIGTQLGKVKTFRDLSPERRQALRTEMYLLSGAVGKLTKATDFGGTGEQKTVSDLKSSLDATSKFIPTWVKFAIALALGCGTTVGWKRIVVTVGEKIGKSHLTYAQGMSAEIVAMSTILFADRMGLPVSTTHVLSSGIAGTMAANRSGLQAQTLRNILLAWVLTLPVCMFLGSVLFAFGNYVVFSIFRMT